MDGVAGRTIAKTDISVFILGHAAHPSIGCVRSKSSLLVKNDGAGRIKYLVPADRHLRAVGDGVAEDCTIVIGEMPDGKAIHHAIAQRVEFLQASGLGHTITASSSIVGDADCGWGGEARSSCSEV